MSEPTPSLPPPSASNADSVARDLRSLKLSAVLYIVIFFAKLGVNYATSVMALLAEAIHTLSEVIVVGV